MAFLDTLQTQEAKFFSSPIFPRKHGDRTIIVKILAEIKNLCTSLQVKNHTYCEETNIWCLENRIGRLLKFGYLLHYHQKNPVQEMEPQHNLGDLCPF